MDQPTKRLVTDMLAVIILLAVGILAYLYYAAPAILAADGLALTVWVAADIILFRKG